MKKFPEIFVSNQKCAIALLLIFTFSWVPAVDYVLNFDGVTHFVDCGNDASLQITDEITIEAWARYDHVTSDWSRIVSKGKWDGSDFGWMLMYTNSPDGMNTGLLFVLEIDGTIRHLSIPATELAESVWYHLAASFDGEFMRLFVDGTERAVSPSYPGSITETDGPYNVLIGQSTGTFSEPFMGSMDEVRIWKKAISASLINEWKGLEVTDLHPQWVYLQGYWRFNDNINPTGDYSLNNNSGNLMQTGNPPIFVLSDVPLPTELSAFFVTFSGEIPLIIWETQSETNNIGWNIYRGETESALQNNQVLPITSNMIEGAGTTSLPSEYSFYDSHNLSTGNTYFYWIESVSSSGSTEIHGPALLSVAQENEEPETPEITEDYGLFQSFPNPMNISAVNPTTVISFKLQEESFTKLTIHNIKGKLVTTLVNKTIPGDTITNINWDGKDASENTVACGIYFAKMKTKHIVKINKLVIMK